MRSPLSREEPLVQYLRAAVKSGIYGADSRDEIGLGVLPERVYAKLLRPTVGSSLAVNLMDRWVVREGRFALTADPIQHNSPALGRRATGA